VWRLSFAIEQARYAEGGRQGAPNAIQVADRFHLSANASAALDEVLRSRRRHVEYVDRNRLCT
jgi:transposase